MPNVPDQTIFDPALGAYLHTGADALEIVGAFPDGADIAVDIETPGLEPFDINCVTAAWHHTDGRVHAVLLDPRRRPRDHHHVQCVLRRAGAVIFHNAPFDVPRMMFAGLLDAAIVNKVVDTVLLARFAYPDPKVSKKLESLAVSKLGFDDFSDGMKRAFRAAGYATIEAGYKGMDIDVPIYRTGAMADTVATLLLEPVLRSAAHHHATDHPFEYYGPTTAGEAAELLGVQETVQRVMLRRSATGLGVDLDYLETYQLRVDDERVKHEAALATAGLVGGTGKGGALIDYLADIGELPIDWPRTPTNKLKATKDLIEALDHPLADAQRQLAVTEKVTGYLAKVMRQAEITGRCHPQVGVLGASQTGRMSCGSPELQQFPADARPAIINADGTGLTSIDWAAIEPVTMALMARDEAFLTPFEAGADLYEPIQRAAGIDRPTAKVVLLATMYGQGMGKLADTIGHTPESAAQIRRQMFAAMPRCARWMTKVEGIADTHGCTITAAGRVLPVDKGFAYKAVNYTIQGSALDVMHAAIAEMERRGIGDELHLAMHDELVVSTPVAEEVQQIMLTPPKFLSRWARRTPTLRTDLADLGRAWQKV